MGVPAVTVAVGTGAGVAGVAGVAGELPPPLVAAIAPAAAAPPAIARIAMSLAEMPPAAAAAAVRTFVCPMTVLAFIPCEVTFTMI